ncbi:hypothetical protein HPP92_015466 [Vanilla planifolia]|uniref:Agenet-like domain-containing protein n=1 Tax=Vanilla planifolia TaxID=51239 RepID=A0A835UX84_VANPL|nr:hypothetical protein HPP92_015466 [Vanilla planifolia]
MDSNDLSLPFKAGQEAESRSFEEGYRSAWFRCKIKGISCRKGALGHRLEYYDYPDEKIRWVKLYQKPPCVVEGLELHKKMELMVRPRYPLFYRESDLPVPLPECDVIVISNDTWKVGDLVDWWCDGCFGQAKLPKY